MADVFLALKWVLSISSCALLSTAGVLPLLLFKFKGKGLEFKAGYLSSNNFVGFALGCLLGEVFLHALPEYWTHVLPTLTKDGSSRYAHLVYGLEFIAGFVTFFVIETIARLTHSDDVDEKKNDEFKLTEDSGHIVSNFINSLKNVHVSGILNLIANCTDNYTHGLAIGVSYLSGIRVGMITFLGVLLHEIPHEVGDVAILLKSGFSFSQVIFGQLITGSFGILGAISSLLLHSWAEAAILNAVRAFTAGGFLYVAAVSLMADLVKKCSVSDVLSVLFGLSVMGTVTIVCGD